MRHAWTALVVALLAAPSLPGEPPVLDSVNVPTLTRSDRFLVKGSHPDGGQIHLSGVEVMVRPIPGTNAVAMNGSVSEDMPYGPAELTVTTAEGTSNTLPVLIVRRTPADRRLWRFELNNPIMLGRPALGPDGTVSVKRNVSNTLHGAWPDGTDTWTLSHEETLLNPAASPAGDTLVIGGAGGGTGFFLAIDSDGQLLWEHQLPREQHDPWTTSVPTPQGRGTWKPDSSVAYTSAIGPSWSGGQCYVYALQVAPIVALEHGLADPAGAPRLAASGSLEPGSPFELDLAQGRAGAPAWLVVGASARGVPFKVGVLLPEPELVVGVPLDGAGALRVGSPWPAGLASESSLYMQVWIDDPAGLEGFAASNALSRITP